MFWPIALLFVGAVTAVGAFYCLTLGQPHQLSLIQFQAISVGAGALISVVIALTLRGEEENGKRPLWPMLLPLICAIFAMGIYYALMIGSPQIMDMLALQGYAVGAGTLLIILISIPFWRGIRPIMSLAGVYSREKVNGIVAKIEASNNSVIGSVLDGISGIDKLMAELAADREIARKALDQAVQNMQAADEKMQQIEQAVEMIRSAVAERTA